MVDEIDRTPEEIEADRAPDNVANETAIKAKRQNVKNDEERIKEALANLLRSTNGRLLLRRILFEWCAYGGPANNKAFDTQAVHYVAGMQAVGINLHAACVNANLDDFMILLRSQLERGKTK
jgi:hypothetical protein